MLTPHASATVTGSEVTMSDTKYVLKFQDGQAFPLNFKPGKIISIGRRKIHNPSSPCHLVDCAKVHTLCNCDCNQCAHCNLAMLRLLESESASPKP